MAETKMLVFTNAMPGRDADFNDWYDNVHLADVVAVPGVSSGCRYRLASVEFPGMAGGSKPTHEYLAVYELSGDAESVVHAFQARAASGEIELSPALDVSTLAVTVWRATGAERAAE